MDKRIDNAIDGVLTTREAAEILGLTNKSVQRHIKSGLLNGIKKDGRYLTTREDVEQFKPRLAGRPRGSVPQWHFPASHNELIVSTIAADLREGISEADFKRALAGIKPGEDYAFPGTIARYILSDQQTPRRVQFLLIWRATVMPSEAEKEAMFTALRAALANVLDWETAQYGTSQIWMHA